MPTTFQETTDRAWFIADAQDQILGRLAVRIARALMGKAKPSWSPHIDTGDFVVVTNAAKVGVSGRKEEDKLYRFHTGYAGGLVEMPLSRMRERKPDMLLRLAVRRMLPKTRQAREMFGRLKIYPGAEHPHAAQKPQPLP